jgi:GT2 family glycosyltransferase
VYKRFSILIVSWNSLDLTRDCLFSIYQYLGRYIFEVIVVDNGSVDGSRDFLVSFSKYNANCFCIFNDTNVGFARGNNQAFEYSKYETIILLNPDTKLINDSIVKLVERVHSNFRIGLVSCSLFNDFDNNQTIHRRLINLSFVFFKYSRVGRMIDKLFFRKLKRRQLNYQNIERKGFVEIEQPAAAVLVFRRELIIKFLDCLFNEEFPIYGNDVDLSKRVLDNGFVNFVDYSVRVWHKGSSSSSNLSKSQLKKLRTAWIPKYYRIHFGKIYVFFARVLLYC